MGVNGGQRRSRATARRLETRRERREGQEAFRAAVERHLSGSLEDEADDPGFNDYDADGDTTPEVTQGVGWSFGGHSPG